MTETAHATAQAYRRPAARRSRLAALCAVAIVSLSGGLLMQLAAQGEVGAPISVSWMFGPAGTISVR